LAEIKTNCLSRHYPRKTWATDYMLVDPILSDDDDDDGGGGGGGDNDNTAHPQMLATHEAGGDRDLPPKATRFHTLSGMYD
jgi:hypothetical protein